LAALSRFDVALASLASRPGAPYVRSLRFCHAEKISASIEAVGSVMLGASPDAVVARYREHVAENTKRLTAA
jgi:hypothetical protein